MHINGVYIEDTYAEGFVLAGTRFLITAENRRWANIAAQSVTGFATSVIACGCEAGIESVFDEGPDGRPGVSVLLMAGNLEAMAQQAFARVSQCVMTCATTACFNGWEEGALIPIGSKMRYFGDGHQRSKWLFGRRFWRIPVMEGEFLVEEHFGTFTQGSDGNIIIIGQDQSSALQAAEAAVAAMHRSGGVMLPFPGGIVRSGSKVGSKYAMLKASTNHEFCPTLRTHPQSLMPEAGMCAYEIVICGPDMGDIGRAMAAGARAAALPGVVKITCGNYGGKLGKVQFQLRELLNA